MFQFENLASILKLPGKKTFNNMDRDFLEKRKKDLNAYLQVGFVAAAWLDFPSIIWWLLHMWNFGVFQLLLNPEMVKACPTLIPHVYDFLENKAYSKGKGEFARKVPESLSVFSLQLERLQVVCAQARALL